MVNKVLLIGNLGADPEVRSTQGGQSVANLRLATSDRVKDRDGNWQDRVEWHAVTCWGKTAENVGQYCRKGKQLYIEGRLQSRKWTDKEGREQRTTEIVADVVKFLGGKEGEGGARGGSGGGGREEPAAGRGRQDDGDEVPFVRSISPWDRV